MINMRSIVIVHSYHHNNTLQVAKAFAEVLNSNVINTVEASNHDLTNYDLICFGAGIAGGKHYKELLDLAKILDSGNGRKCVIFSTGAFSNKRKTEDDHEALRKILSSKQYQVLGDFSCKGYNTNSFMKYVGGMNRGHPNQDDLDNARNFISNIMSQLQAESKRV